jgi:hypothetical protein
LHEAAAMRFALCCLFVAACAPEIYEDADLDADPDLDTIAEDDTPEEEAVDDDTSETSLGRSVSCTKQRFLHIANYSFVAPLDCVNGVCPNGCWGYQRRTSGFACDYAAGEADKVKTRPGDGPFASYNEIKPLNASASCRAQSGGRSLRTYVVWNGAGWNREGIAAAVTFAELYGPQHERSPHFWTWYNGAARATYAPMTNLSPETNVTFEQTKQDVARLCSATRTGGWLGIYFYDPDGAGGAGMSDWKREAIIRGMNYCTTH